MQNILLIAVLLPLIGIVYQDFKYRAIHWVLLVVLFSSLTIIGLLENHWIMVAQNLSLNILFLTMQFVLLFMYFSLKNKRLTNIINSYIGIGDVLFLGSIAVAFSLLNFIVFLLASLLLVIAAYFLLFMTKKGVKKEIPLAGMLAIGFIVSLVLDSFSVINLRDDSLILNTLQLI